MKEEAVSDLGEDGLVDRLTKGLPVDPTRVIEGPGDDCAVVKTADPTVFGLHKTDCVVETIHFLPGTDPESVGWKAMARAVSDIAAMGATARPISALITIAVAKNREVKAIEGWMSGMKRCAEKFELSIVGGETTSLPKDAPALISVAVIGEVPAQECVFRNGANIDDFIAVTGKLGGSLESGRHLNFEPRIGFESGQQPTAMMDLSDGLAKDLPRLAKSSGVGFRLDCDAIPIHENSNLQGALTDGEDYELLMTLSEKPATNSGITVIGKITETIETPLNGGWDHFG